jgi:RNA polymerase sigma factor (sigma-70 family)
MRDSREKNILHRDHLAQLYESHARDLVVYARSILRNLDDAQELVHDLFCSLYDKVENDKISTDSIRAFLYVSVKHRAFNLLKKNKKTAELSDHHALTKSSAESVDDSMILEDVYKYIRTSFSAEKQEIFFLRIVHDLTWKEISEITGKAVSSVHFEFNEMVLAVNRRFPDVL